MNTNVESRQTLHISSKLMKYHKQLKSRIATKTGQLLNRVKISHNVIAVVDNC